MDERSVVVHAKRWVGDHTIALEVDTPPGIDPKPGQFFLIRATIDGEEYARHYTMSSPHAKDTFELTIGIDPEGALTPWLASIEPGETLTVAGPFGEVYYDDEPSSIVLAGGPGIGAGLGVAERAVIDGNTTAIVARYDDEEHPHEDRLSRLATDGVQSYVSTTDDGFASAVTSLASERPEATWFIFGFKPFIDAAVTAIEAGGGDTESAKIENYG